MNVKKQALFCTFILCTNKVANGYDGYACAINACSNSMADEQHCSNFNFNYCFNQYLTINGWCTGEFDKCCQQIGGVRTGQSCSFHNAAFPYSFNKCIACSPTTNTWLVVDYVSTDYDDDCSQARRCEAGQMGDYFPNDLHTFHLD